MRSVLSVSTRRAVIVAVLVVLALFFAFSRSEEARVRNTLDRVSAALSGPVDRAREAKVKQSLSELCTADVHVEIPDVFVGSGRERAIEAALGVMRGATPVISLEHIELKRAGMGRMEADFDARVSESQAGDLHGDIRRVHALLVKSDSGWQVAALDSTPHDARLPEARP